MPDTPTTTAAAEARTLLDTLTRFLAGVAVLALVFTAVNVTLFAVASGIPWPIAILLDPLVALTLTAVLYADARLAALGIRPPGWSMVLRWGCGLTAALLNTWTSLWPDGRLGWPTHAHIAGVVLHAVPPLLLIGLTETVAAYRRTLTTLAHADTALSGGLGHHDGERPESNTGSPDTPALSTNHPPVPASETVPGTRSDGAPLPLPRSITALCRSSTPASDTGSYPRSAPAQPVDPPTTAPPSPVLPAVGTHVGPQTADSTPTTTSPAPAPYHGTDSAADGELFARALALDAASRALSDKPVSIRRLRTELHLGPKRARALHDRIQAHHAEHSTA